MLLELWPVSSIFICFPKQEGSFIHLGENLHMSTFHSACYVSYGKQVLKPTMYNVIIKVNSFFLAIFSYVL